MKNFEELLSFLQKNNFRFQTLKFDAPDGRSDLNNDAFDRFLTYLQQESQKYKDIRIELHEASQNHHILERLKEFKGPKILLFPFY